MKGRHPVARTGDIVKTLLRTRLDTLTPSERRVASCLLQDYPVAGLQSITELAQAAEVSTPTVIRLARKLDFDGFSALQEALRAEISAQIKKPLSKLDEVDRDDSGAHRLHRFAAAASANLRNTLDRLDPADFDAAVAPLAGPERRIFIEGGRITRSLADYLFNLLQIIRPGVAALGRQPSIWPQYLIDMGPDAVMVLFDVRRYEADLLRLARLARDRDCRLILFTDQWGSPIGSLADVSFHAMIEAPSSWDSMLAPTLILEALVAEVQAAMPDKARGRIGALESMLSATRLFREPG